MLKIICSQCQWPFLAMEETSPEQCPQCGSAQKRLEPEGQPPVQQELPLRFAIERPDQSRERVGIALCTFLVMTLVGLFVQLPGWEMEHWSAPASPVKSTERNAASRSRFHEIHWAHGFPLCYLERKTTFRPSSANFDPRDQSPLAISRGVKSVRFDLFILNLLLWGALPTFVFLARGLLRR